jgi:serine/threonine-protein kinase
VNPRQNLAHYRILSKLGEGGMGEVWRAADTKLGRDVAIKILPDSFAQDPDRMARFTREAKVLASLNHPNIAVIHGVEERALVMELVEGPTLAERIAQGPMPLEEALPVARQIAEALEYAHEHGVVHRDLKPANIKVTAEGRVKVLDFGLAKAMSSDAAPAGNPESSPTLTMQETVAGKILGTAAYVSPEQARGQKVDRRADIWAFGVVLCEMLTGRRVFGGPTISDTLAAVLKAEPDLTGVPAQVRPLVERCLRKDPGRRWQAIGDVRIALEEGPPAAPPSRAAALPWLAAGALAVALVIAGAGWWRAARPPDRPLMRLSVDLGPDALVGFNTTIAISPDGTRLVYPARGRDGRQQLATRLLSDSKVTLLPGTESAADPFFSPDGQWTGFFADGKLKKISVQGGAPMTLASVAFLRGAAWVDEGTIIAAPALSGLFRIPAAGGTPQPLTKPSDTGEYSHRWPQALPGGHAVLFTASPSDNFEDAHIDVLSWKTGQRKAVLRGGYFGRYLPGGYLVYMHQGTLFGVGFDPAHLEIRGTPSPLLEDVSSRPMVIGSGQFDVSRTGSLVYLSGTAGIQKVSLAWLDGADRLQVLPAPPGPYLTPRLSRDGTRLAFQKGYAPGDLWVYDWRRDTMSRLTFTARFSTYPVWTPDGRHIAFSSAGGIFWVRADGAGDPQRVLESGLLSVPYSFSPDGHRLAFFQMRPGTDYDLWTLPLDTSDPDHPKAGRPELFLGTSAIELRPAFSPDGHWIAYESSEAGSEEIYVRPFPSGSGKWQVSTGGGQFPIWSRDGRQLFYETLDHRIMAADYTARGDSFAAGKPRLWSTRRIASTSFSANLDLHPDGKRFVVLSDPDMPSEQKNSVHATFLLNFSDEVKRRIP